VVSPPLQNVTTPLYRKLSVVFLPHVTCTGATFSYPHKRFLIPHPTRLAPSSTRNRPANAATRRSLLVRTSTLIFNMCLSLTGPKSGRGGNLAIGPLNFFSKTRFFVTYNKLQSFCAFPRKKISWLRPLRLVWCRLYISLHTCCKICKLYSRHLEFEA